MADGTDTPKRRSLVCVGCNGPPPAPEEKEFSFFANEGVCASCKKEATEVLAHVLIPEGVKIVLQTRWYYDDELP